MHFPELKTLTVREVDQLLKSNLFFDILGVDLLNCASETTLTRISGWKTDAWMDDGWMLEE